MKRVIIFLLCLIPALSFAFDLDIEARVGWLVPKSSTMRKVYGKGFPEYELELGIPLNKCFTVFSNLSYYEASGHSTLHHHRSDVQNYGLILGGKYYFQPWTYFRPYFGLGGGAGHIRFHDRNPYLKSFVNHSGWAILAKVGTEICLSRYLYLDLFADYVGFSYNFKDRKGIGGHHLNAGGIKAGAALGIRF